MCHQISSKLDSFLSQGTPDASPDDKDKISPLSPLPSLSDSNFGKKKGTRRTFSDEQVAKLETYFDYKRYFTPGR